MHLKYSSYALRIALYRVIHRAARFDLARIDTEEAELSDEGVRRYLERESRKRLRVAGVTELFLVRLGVDTLD